MSRRIYSYIFIFFISFIVGINNIEAKKISDVNIGDYIKMTPINTSYMPTKEDTGCLNNESCTQNTLNPSELNLWRVIKKNDDGTVDVVSVYVSSSNIYFYGTDGYLNLVGGLNKIAAQYTNPKYVQSTRHMGYSNQLEKCTELSTSVCPSDNGYETDTNLVNNSLGTLIGKTPNGSTSAYFLASRYIISDSTSSKYNMRYINASGQLGDITLFFSNDTDGIDSEAIRPILTLKADIDLPLSTIKEDGKDFYDLDSVDKEEVKPIEPGIEDDNNKGQDNINDEQSQKPSLKNEVENPNTGDFVACILLFSIIILIIFIFNMTKRRKIFKL